MPLEGLDELINKYLKTLDEEYQKALSLDLENFAKRLIEERVKSLEPLRRKIMELFRS